MFEQKGYKYCHHISTGGEGEVHLVEKDGVFYIAKIFNKLEENSIKLLEHIKEIKAPNVPKICEIYNHNDNTILIRQYIDGHTLYDEIKKEGMLSFERAKFITLKICETLNTFHNLKPNPIIYRDLKPENIMISNSGDVFLIDFGIARYHKEEVTRDTVLAGTKGYTAPEVMAGMQSDKRSDIYSIGLIFYEMITGKNLLVPPFQVRPVRESNEFIPSWVDNIIKKATGLSMVSRFKDIDEFTNSLKKPKKFRLNKGIAVLAGSIMIVAMIVGIGFGFYRMNNDRQNYNILLNLQFDDKADANWVDIMGENAESIIAEECVENGVFTLKEEIQLKQALTSGKYIHVRVKAPDFDKDGSMFMLDLKNDKPDFDDEFRSIRFYFQNNQPLSLDVQTSKSFAPVNQSYTSMLMRSNMIVDIIVWFDERDNSIRYVISDTENESNICYMGLTLDEEWADDAWMVSMSLDTGFWNGTVKSEELYTDIEFIRMSSGLIDDYLMDNVSAYSNYKERIDAFIEDKMPLASEMNFISFD